MKFLKITSIILALAVFSGCASLPKPEEMETDIVGYELPELPEAGKAIVYVVRPSSVGSLIRFNVFVDDEEASSEMGLIMARNSIFQLPDYQGKYQVKHLELGTIIKADK
jgi:hypothetical protein